MYRGNNPAALASRKLILDTLKELLTVKKFKDISIKELCSHSGVSRQTFYAHFGTKENIIFFYLEDLYHMLLSPEGPYGLPPLCGCKVVSKYVIESYDLMTMLVRNELMDMFETVLFRACFSNPVCYPNIKLEDERRDAIHFLCAGTRRVIEIYVRDHEVPDEEELEEKLYNVMSGNVFYAK